jgi:Protein of unknown function (DUF2721)
MNSAPSSNLPSILGVISAMITPAILILGTGSLVTSTLTRIARVFDRARDVLAKTVEATERGDVAAARTYKRWLRLYRRRSVLAERALTFYYVAIFLFVVSSLTIALVDVTRIAFPWISLIFVLLGAGFLCAATAFLVIETNMAAGLLRAELDQELGVGWHLEAGGDEDDPTAAAGAIG